MDAWDRVLVLSPKPHSYLSGQRNGQRFTYVLHQVSIQEVRLLAQIDQTRRAKDDSNPRGFADTHRAAGLLRTPPGATSAADRRRAARGNRSRAELAAAVIPGPGARAPPRGLRGPREIAHLGNGREFIILHGKRNFVGCARGVPAKFRLWPVGLRLPGAVSEISRVALA